MIEKIQAELKTAMKERNELKTSVLRMLISDFKYAQIEKKAPLDEAESLQVIQKAIKKRKEAAELYEKGGRPELAEKETAEAKILESFGPAQMDEAAAKQKIAEVIQELGAKDKKDLGLVMKEVLKRYRGQLDGKLAQKIVNELLP
ncbi:MAG TPA: GatB/YqeY domain-containing protein [Acidobacteriota bacterium]|jgi:uncharacterized protein YqeY|nr:GatB/YqeY domain-containing protein [Acidobacteriota bacterium]